MNTWDLSVAKIWLTDRTGIKNPDHVPKSVPVQIFRLVRRLAIPSLNRAQKMQFCVLQWVES